LLAQDEFFLNVAVGLVPLAHDAQMSRNSSDKYR
jgi:hypothetical protein